MTFGRHVIRIAAAVCLCLLVSPAPAVSQSEVRRFAELADRFDAQLPRPRLQDFSERAKLRRAACILTGLEDRHGARAVEAALSLMRVLAEGAQFDDPTIIAFDAEFGAGFDRLVARCTDAA